MLTLNIYSSPQYNIIISAILTLLLDKKTLIKKLVSRDRKLYGERHGKINKPAYNQQWH